MKRLLLLLSLALSMAAGYGQNSTLPYFNGFENPGDTAGIVFKKRANGTPWCVGSAQHCLGQNSLYISPDSGLTATYAYINGGYVSIAYLPISLPLGTYSLSFDYTIGGDGTNQELKAAWVPSSVSLAASATGSSFPTSINNNQFVTYGGQSTFTSAPWTHVSGTVVVASAGSYNLCFAFRSNSNTILAPGACIDNIQIDTVRQATDCLFTPHDISVTKDANAGVIVCWQGNASSYEVVAASATDPDDHSYETHTGITTTCDTFQYSELTDGQYFFYVRPICGSDTGIYGETSGHLIYDVAAHCIDFINFNAPGTVCTYGTYSNPYQTTGYIDNGPSQISSRHTVHTDLAETDPRTNGALHTVPTGEIMSVRLGNWDAGAQAESITYTYDVPAGSNKILLVKYAVVFEEPSHSEPPEFKLEIMNSNNQLLDPVCTKANFLCNGTLANGWHYCTLSSTGTSIWYKDWSSIGVNLTQYAGNTVKIRLTSYDCDWSGHFGYGYFIIGCTDAELAVAPYGSGSVTQLSAPDGFSYQWTNECTNQVVSTSQTFLVSDSDVCSYSCRCSYLESPQCYFTLATQGSPTYPNASFSYTLSYSDCQTHITFNNESYAYKIIDNQRVIIPNSAITAQSWYIQSDRDTIFSSNWNLPTIDIPASGDTLYVQLATNASNNWDDTTAYIVIPPLQRKSNTTSVVVGKNEPYSFCNKTYTFISCDSVEVEDAEGGKSYIQTDQMSVVVPEYFATWYGCDSVVILDLSAAIAHITALSNDESMGSVSGSGCYDIGESVVLRAMSQPGHHFVRWQDGNRDSVRSVVVNADITYTATFAVTTVPRHLVTVTANDLNMGSVYGSGMYDFGEPAVVKAVANEHYRFVSWDNGNTADSISFVVQKDTTFTALFEAVQYNLVVLANYAERGTVTGTGKYPYLENVAITATPNEGYQFAGWSNGETDQATFIIVECDSIVTAYFEPIQLTGVESAGDIKVNAYVESRQIVITDAEIYAIYDSTGKLIASGKMNGKTQRVSVNIPGVYYLFIDGKQAVKLMVH